MKVHLCYDVIQSTNVERVVIVNDVIVQY